MHVDPGFSQLTSRLLSTLEMKNEKLLSSFAFNFNLRPSSKGFSLDDVGNTTTTAAMCVVIEPRTEPSYDTVALAVFAPEGSSVSNFVEGLGDAAARSSGVGRFRLNSA